MPSFGSFEDIIGASGGHIAWWQMSIRAVIVFFLGVVLIRLLGRRAFGKHSAIDIVLAIIIGSNLSRALTGNAPFLPTVAATIALLLCFQLIDHVAARWHWLGRALKGDPVWLCRDGALDEEAMKRSGISEGDIEEAARQAGLPGLSAVREAILERSGEISTIGHRTS